MRQPQEATALFDILGLSNSLAKEGFKHKAYRDSACLTHHSSDLFYFRRHYDPFLLKNQKQPTFSWWTNWNVSICSFLFDHLLNVRQTDNYPSGS